MRKRTGMGAATAALLLCASAGSADSLTFDIVVAYSGTTPVNVGTAKFTSTTAGVVNLLMTFSNKPGGKDEFISGWWFNLADAFDPAQLKFQRLGSTPGIVVNGVTAAKDAKTLAPGHGFYDVEFDFAPPPGDPGSVFGAGKWIEYEIRSGEAITAQSFNAFSVPGSHGPFKTVARVQGIAFGEGSGWVTVPLPPTAWAGLAGLGLAAGVSVVKRRR